MTRPLRLLFLSPFAPDLRGAHGGTRATAAIIDMLSHHHRVTVLYLAAPGRAAAAPAAGQLRAHIGDTDGKARERPGAQQSSATAGRPQIAVGCPEWVEECWSPVMASRAATIAAEFEPDVVHYEFHVIAQYIPFVRSACPQAAGIVTEHEPGIIADAVRDAPPTLRERVARLARRRASSRYERRTLRKADSIIVFTSSDAAALERLLGTKTPRRSAWFHSGCRPPIHRWPSTSAPIKLGFRIRGQFPSSAERRRARRLVRSIFPMILRKLPEATLTIVGADPPQDLVDAASDRATVTGWVDDPSIYLAGAAVVLVPLRQGGGLRVKMLEACAAGKAIVASPMAVEGLSLETARRS